MKKIKIFAGFLSLMAFALLMGCNKDSEAGNLNLVFDHKVSGEALELETKDYQSAAGHSFNVFRLKYYVSEIKLFHTDGSSINFDPIHYRDIENNETRMLDLGVVPGGEYNRLAFTFGLDETINVDGGLPNTQANVNMEWPIPGDQGYHYMKFEGKYKVNGVGDSKNFNLHTGATRGNQNYLEVSIPFSSMNVDGNELSIRLEMDLMEWLQNPNVYDFEVYGPMIMMNQDAQAILKENGQTVFSIGDIQ